MHVPNYQITYLHSSFIWKDNAWKYIACTRTTCVEAFILLSFLSYPLLSHSSLVLSHG
eukprot:c42732_g1_i1 orf=90-263(+)